MKLLNQSLAYLIISILAIIGVWGVVFYFNLLKEIKSSMDEGLENYKRVIIQNAKKDSSILDKPYFDESFFTIESIRPEIAHGYVDRYRDTTLLMQDADDELPEAEPVRMLSTTFELNGIYYELHIANSMVEEDDLIKELIEDVIWLFILLMVGVFLINNWMLKAVWRPFYSFLADLKSFKIGSGKEIPKVETRTKEFLDLELAVNALVRRGNAAFAQQKEFIGNASHELQTPLAIAMGKLDLLLEKEELNESSLEKIGEIYQVIKRLISLNKSLLLLSKIENKQFLNNKPISISKLIQEIVEDFEELLEFKDIQVKMDLKMDVSFSMDPDLARILFNNLIKNAIFHNLEKGEISLEISDQQFKISNSGSEEKLDAELIFHRFHRSNSNTEGTGLGLAISKAIAELYEIQLSYFFLERKHSFVLDFSKVS